MIEPEALAAWRLFSFNWFMLGAMAITLVLGMAVTGFSIAPISLLKPAIIIGAYVGYTYYKRYRSKKNDPFVIFILGSTGQILLIPALMTPLTYVAASANLPLQDAALNAIDQALGLDWMAYYNFVCGHYVLLAVAVWSYSMIAWPLFAIPVMLGWTGRFRRLQEFTLGFGIALAATTLLSIFVPAMGTYDFYHFRPDLHMFTPGGYLEQLRDLPIVRDGSLRHLFFNHLTGIVSFPSFHAASALLYLWAVWPVRWIGPLISLVMIAMLLATAIVGGHYFIDIFAGLTVAGGAIFAAKRIAAGLTRTAVAAQAEAAPLAIAAE